MLVLSENCWRWVLSDEDYPECRCDDLLCVLVEERLPVQVDIAACQAVPPCPHLKFPPDSRFQITMFKETDHNVSTTSGTIVLPANKKVFNFTSFAGVWHLAICSARLAAAGRNVQVRLGQRVGRNLEIERIWPFIVYQVVFLPHPQWKSWWIRRLGIENGQPWAWVWLVDQLSSNVEEHSIDLLSIARSSSDQKIPALQICFFLLPNFQFLINLYQY